MKLLLLGAFIGAATMFVLLTLRTEQGELSDEAADRIWHSIVGEAKTVTERDVRTDDLLQSYEWDPNRWTMS